MADPHLIELIKEILASGANGATIAIFLFIWRLDSRVRHLEILRELEKKAAS